MTNKTMPWLRYANSGAKRNRPLDPKHVGAPGFLQDMGIKMEVFSGGQVTASEAARGFGMHVSSSCRFGIHLEEKLFSGNFCCAPACISDMKVR